MDASWVHRPPKSSSFKASKQLQPSPYKPNNESRERASHSRVWIERFLRKRVILSQHVQIRMQEVCFHGQVTSTVSSKRTYSVRPWLNLKWMGPPIWAA